MTLLLSAMRACPKESCAGLSKSNRALNSLENAIFMLGYILLRKTDLLALTLRPVLILCLCGRTLCFLPDQAQYYVRLVGQSGGTKAIARTIVPLPFLDRLFLTKYLLERVGPKQLQLVPFIVPRPATGTTIDRRTRSRSHPKVGTEQPSDNYETSKVKGDDELIVKCYGGDC